jgi:hypothetical protein
LNAIAGFARTVVAPKFGSIEDLPQILLQLGIFGELGILFGVGDGFLVHHDIGSRLLIFGIEESAVDRGDRLVLLGELGNGLEIVGDYGFDPIPALDLHDMGNAIANGLGRMGDAARWAGGRGDRTGGWRWR